MTVVGRQGPKATVAGAAVSTPSSYYRASWNTPIDSFGGSEWQDGYFAALWNLSTSPAIVPIGALVVVTVDMWMPSGMTPTVQLGRFINTSTFDDQTAAWTAMPVFQAGNIWTRSWYRTVNAQMQTDGYVEGLIKNFKWRSSGSVNDSTDGGNTFSHTFIGKDGAPHPTSVGVAYTQSGSSALIATPQQPATSDVLHLLFARSGALTSTSNPKIMPFGLVTAPPQGINQGNLYHVSNLEDNYRSVEVQALDRYGIGFYWSGKTGTTPAYDGTITWDLQTTPSPLGVSDYVIRGLTIGGSSGGLGAVSASSAVRGVRHV